MAALEKIFSTKNIRTKRISFRTLIWCVAVLLRIFGWVHSQSYQVLSPWDTCIEEQRDNATKIFFPFQKHVSCFSLWRATSTWIRNTISCCCSSHRNLSTRMIGGDTKYELLCMQSSNPHLPASGSGLGWFTFATYCWCRRAVKK